jgi:hypothetical protein
MALYLSIFTCCIGAVVQGWDHTGSNGVDLSFPNVFGIGTTFTKDTLLVGLVNSAPYVGSAFVGCWVSDPINYTLLTKAARGWFKTPAPRPSYKASNIYGRC